MSNALFEALTARAPHPSLGSHAETYGRLVGSWQGELYNHMRDGPPTAAGIEIHFAWALEGRAIVDTWLTPARADRTASRSDSGLDWYGTTVRLFDPKSGTWRATWLDPVMGFQIQLEGRRQGDDIVQVGTRGGWPIRWTFSEIRASSFLWQGHVLNPDGQTWRLEVEVRVRRSMS